MNSNKLRGFEVLVRWNSKTFGNISPTEFIYITEKSKLIISTGEWILENAMIQFKKIQSACSDKIILSVNLSVLQLLNSNF
jgi:EAL domain-containing protein (putative c-di-GMP-specific phosphodiesterase class I)